MVAPTRALALAVVACVLMSMINEAPAEWWHMLAGLYNCAWWSALVELLGLGSGVWARAPWLAKGLCRVLGRLSFGVCLLHQGLILGWVWGPWVGADRQTAPFALVWALSLLL